jgi:uncharacterized MAPEG superfamily protein
MLFAHWMLLVATFLPIVAVSFAKASKKYDNHQPRAYVESLGDNTLQKRMAWAQENSWEALMMFAPAVLLATFLHVDSGVMNLLAGGFIAARLVYLWCYAKNLATARSSIWFVGVICVIGLYVASAMA